MVIQTSVNYYTWLHPESDAILMRHKIQWLLIHHPDQNLHFPALFGMTQPAWLEIFCSALALEEKKGKYKEEEQRGGRGKMRKRNKRKRKWRGRKGEWRWWCGRTHRGWEAANKMAVAMAGPKSSVTNTRLETAIVQHRYMQVTCAQSGEAPARSLSTVSWHLPSPHLTFTYVPPSHIGCSPTGKIKGENNF